MREHETSLVIGCGEQGAKWVDGKNSGGLVIGLDKIIPQSLQDNRPLFIQGDVFQLPLKSGSVDQIFGDFIVNGVISRNIAAPQIIQNPEVLNTNYFPEIVRTWYRQTMNYSPDLVRENIKTVGSLLRITALREMWRVLAENGTLQIIDLEYNTNWIAHFAPQILNENPKKVLFRPLSINEDDFSRSESLQKLLRARRNVQKISLTKKPQTPNFK